MVTVLPALQGKDITNIFPVQQLVQIATSFVPCPLSFSNPLL